jgi:hypothetical protein
MVMMKRKTSSDHWPVLRTGCQGCNRGKVLRFIVTTASLIPSCGNRDSPRFIARDAAIHATGQYEENHRTPDGRMASTKKHPALRKQYRRQEEIDDQVMQSARNLCGTVPTTAAGLIALLQYVEELGEETTAKLWTARPSRQLSAHGNLRPGFRAILSW